MAPVWMGACEVQLIDENLAYISLLSVHWVPTAHGSIFTQSQNV